MKPFIVGEGLTNMVVKKGQVVKYDIKYGGEPEPEVSWKLNGQEIKADGDRQVKRTYEHFTCLLCFSTCHNIPLYSTKLECHKPDIRWTRV